MNIYSNIRDLVVSSLDKMVSDGFLEIGLRYDNISVEPPRDQAHGDMATNAAMVLAKLANKPPRQIAEYLSNILISDERVREVNVAGPGFINIRIEEPVLQAVVKSSLLLGSKYGQTQLGNGKRVNVEYISANPTGPLHVGHTRGAVFGDALSNLLNYVGYDVTREYYINDGGTQVDVLARSVYLRYLEAHGQEVVFEDGTYPGEYLVEVGLALKAEVGDRFLKEDEKVWLEFIRDYSTDIMMKLIREDLDSLGIKMDNYFSEKSVYSERKIDLTIEQLSKRGLIYEGVLEPPKGKKLDDWSPRKQTLFKSTNFGDDVDRPVKKSDGTWTYFAPDIAYHFDKIDRGYDILIDILGADHGGYVKRMKAAVLALSDTKVELDVKLVQLVKLYRNGVPFKMSKRAGTFVTLSDLIHEVGSDVVRFVMLTRKNDAPLDFDLEKVLDQSKDNPVFYVQYAHARVCSVLRKAVEADIDVSDQNLASADLSQNNHQVELRLIKKLAEWPRLVQVSAKTNEPHRVAFYLYELAGDFHSLWNKGNDEKRLRFIQEDTTIALAKLALARSVAIVISSGLSILGVEAVSEMR
ncbi:MAG: arginine--tRNA ligase [Rhodobacteraceae bacterium]|nr:arginine--tRNA ligase [Paracoccaceae bacterium]